MDCYFTTFHGDLITAAEPLNHDIDLMSCEFTVGSILSLATGATVLAIEGGSDIGTITNSGTGLFTITGSYVDSVSCLNAGGEIRIRGGTVNSVTRAVGSVVWWRDDSTILVLPSATITDGVIGYALVAAGVGDVVLVHPGTYTEPITCAASVDLKGVGPASGVIITQVDADIITLANNVELENLTVRLVNPPGVHYLIQDSGVACTARITNVVLEITTPGAFAHQIFHCSAASNLTIERCSYNIGGTGPAIGIENRTAAATFHLINNDFTFTNVDAYHIHSNQAGTWTGGGNRWAGTCGMFIAVAGTITFDNDAMVCSAVSAVTGGTVCFRTGYNSYEVFPGMDINHSIGTGRYIFLHPGTFTMVASLALVNNLTIEGSGRQSIITTSTADLDIITGSALTGVILKNFQIDGDLGGVACDMGIYFINVNESKLIDVYVQDCGEDCIMLEDCDRTEVQHSYGDNSTEHGLFLLSCTYCPVIGGHFNNNTLDGVHIRGDATGNADYNTVNSVEATGNGSDGVEISEEGAGDANKNIVLICQLVPNTGLALNDGGTNTEQGHNITV